jgi:hypothetical protein
MPKRTWLAPIVLGIVVLGFVSGVQAQVGQNDEQRQTSPEENPADSSSFAIPIEIIEDQAEADARQRREQEADQRQIDDLLAQQGMDQATQRMTDLAEKQTWLIGIGTLLLFVTLYFAYQANRAAFAAVKVTKDIGERQVRAYVHPDGFTLTHTDDEFLPCVTMHYKNFGQSPARRIVKDIKVSFVFIGRAQVKESEFKADETGLDLGPGQRKSTSAVFRFYTGLREAIVKEMVTLHVHGTIRYFDVFDEKRETHFHVSLFIEDGKLPNTSKNFLVCDDGNESS